jgi:hypothetical protein
MENKNAVGNVPPHFLCSCVRADGFNSKLQMLPEHNIAIVCTYSSGGQ